MKRLLLVAVLVLTAFLVGLVSTYSALPYVAPEVVASLQQHTAGLAQADTSMAFDSTATARPDSASAEALPVPAGLAESFADSLDVMQRTLDASRAKAMSLEQTVAHLRQQIAALEKHRTKTLELSGTLAQLEERELEAILQQLDMPVLEQLYAEASGRNRKRLLAAMPPPDAARFVSRLLTISSPAKADTP